VSALAERGAVAAQARLGNRLVSRMIRVVYGVRLHDIGSFRIKRCSLLETIGMRKMTYGWPVEMLVKAARTHCRFLELPIHYRHRSHGRSKEAGTPSGCIKTAYCMLRTTIHYTRTRRKHA
jgi:hypothetical protein